MDFSFTEEQQLLEDTVRRFVAKDYAFEKRRAIRDSDEGWSRGTWQALADLGLLALNVPEEHGGLGAGPVDTMLAMNALEATPGDLEPGQAVLPDDVEVELHELGFVEGLERTSL